MTIWIVTTKVRSKDGTKPVVRVLGGSVLDDRPEQLWKIRDQGVGIYIYLSEGQTAKWTVKRLKKRETT